MDRINDVGELTPQMQDKVNAFLLECYKQGVDVYPFETIRSQERQLHLAGKNRTIAECIALGMTPGEAEVHSNPSSPMKRTWTLNSKHKAGKACDFAFGGDGLWHWNGDWDKMIEIAKDFGLDSLAPTESAHLQDNGKPLTKKQMTDYTQMAEAVGVLTALTGDDNLQEKQIKALINIGCNRLKDQIKEDLIKEIVEKLQK